MTSFVDTALNWGNTALDYYNDNPALQGVVQGGLSYLGSNSQRNANDTSTGQIIAGQQQGLSTLNKTWGTAQKQAQPYLNFGNKGLRQYSNLIDNPNSIRRDPGYLFRLAEGSGNLERSAAAAGTHLSGGTLADLTKYGQEYATAEYDKALNRRIPMIETGLNTQQNLATLGAGYAQAIGEIYGNIGGARAAGTQANEATRQGTLGDISNILTRLADGKSVYDAGQTGLSMLGGNTSGAASTMAGGVGAMEALGGAGTAAGVVGAPVAAPFVGAQFSMPGSVAAMDALGGGGATTLGGGGLSSLGAAPAAAQAGATGATSATGATTAAGASAAWLAAPFAMVAIGKFIDSLKGGSVESAKAGKFASQLQRDMQADPTGQKANATMAKLVNGNLWKGEQNGWVVGGLIRDGVLPINSPLLYSKESKYNPFELKGSQYSGKDAVGGMAQMLSYGIPQAQVKQYWDAKTKLAGAQKEWERRVGDDPNMRQQVPSPMDMAKTDTKTQALFSSVESKMTPANRLRTATRMRAEILAATPGADVTKLDKFIRSNS